ncbi:MAG: hypothetical protein ACTHJ4_04590 [Candidatus Nucleicultricaceae bacterium]
MAEKESAKKYPEGEEVVLLEDKEPVYGSDQEPQQEKPEQEVEKKAVFDPLSNPKIYWKVAVPKVSN